ncbi:MAG: response regulator [Acidobacteriia bacterium]|nr:response regulator [Terriglobia bacterium]
MSERFRVLLIDDNPDDRSLVLRQLEREFADLEVEQITEAEGFERALAAGGFGLVITDYQLMWIDGLEILRATKARWPDCPVVMFTGTGGEEIAVEAMKAGLDDYVLKSPRHFVRLRVAARSAVDRARQRRAVKEGEERYWRLFDGLPIGLYLSSPDGHAIDANPALAEMLGYPDRDSFLNCRMPDHYADPGDRARWIGRMERDGVVRDFEARLRRHDGATIWVRDSARAERGPDGEVHYYEGSLEDVTERKRAEAQLHLLESAIRNAGEGIVIVAIDGESPRVVFVNPAYCEMTGYEAKELLDRPPDVLAGPKTDPAEIARLREALAGGRATVGEAVCYRKDGSEFVLEWHLAPLRGQGGQVTHLVSIQRDVTEREAVSDQLRQAQKMEAVGRLAGGIAHDFNNILTVIGGYGEILRGAHLPDPTLRRHLDTIVAAAEHADALTRRLLAFSRKQLFEPRISNLNAIVTDMERLLHRLLGEDIHLAIDLDPRLANVRVDVGQIEQVVVNLAVNARDAMSRGGTLRIETANVAIEEASATSPAGLVPGSYARMTITDTGHGMDAETRGRIFEPFFTTKENGRGTGLGLATVKRIVRQSAGLIDVRSEPGRGAAFEILLPAVAGPAEPTGAAQVARPPGGSETVLVVEDEPAIRTLLTEILEEGGYRVMTAGRGQDAIDLLERSPGPVHLLLTDVVMPGMSGRDLADHVQPARPGLKALFISGYSPEEVSRRGVASSGSAFLQKPFSSGSLLRKVREVLDGP